MKLRKDIIKLALLASVFTASASAQELPRSLRSTYPDGQGVVVEQNPAAVKPLAMQPSSTPSAMGEEIPGKPIDVIAPATAVPAQAASAPAASTAVAPSQPVDVTPKLAAADQILSPQALNSDKTFAESQFKKQFDNMDNSTTMEQVLSDAYEKNPSINSARESLKAVDEELNQAYGGFLPNVNFQYNHDFERDDFGNGGGKQSADPESKTFNVRQGLFGGGETVSAVKSAEARVSASQADLKNTEQQFLFNAITSYINYIYTQKVLKLAENNEDVLQEQLKASQERFVVGDATKTDVAQSQARLANAVSNRVLANGDFINAKATYKRVFGLEAPIVLPMPNKLPDIPATLEDSVVLGMKNNPQLNTARFTTESRNHDIGVQESQLLPQVDLNGSIGDSESATEFGIQPKSGSSVGVTVTVPIYTQGITYSRTREAKNRRDQAKQVENDTSNGVKSAVVQAWQNILTTKTNIDATKSSLVASESALEGVREEQKEGARTVLDVLDAEQERFIAETAHARAIKDSVLAIYNMKLVLGELNSQQLGLSVPEYDVEKHYKNTRFKLIGL